MTYAPTDKTESVRTPSHQESRASGNSQFVDNRSSTVSLRAMQQQMRNLPIVQSKSTQMVEEDESLQEMAPAQLIEGTSVAGSAPAEMPNNTGLPDNLKSGIESLSGMSMDHVKVHFNSDKPAQLNAHAYAQGSDIYVASGQEKHLPHEAWHVVQQAQGRVRPTMQMKRGVPVNDDAGLEHEADVMGERALSASKTTASQPIALQRMELNTEDDESSVIQGMFTFRVDTDDFTIKDPVYKRTFGKYLTGNSENKHVTADAVKDELWTGLEGLRIDAFAQKLLDIVEVYLALPGVDLIRAHVLDEDEEGVNAPVLDDGLNGPMRTNFAKFDEVHNELNHHASNVAAYKSKFLEGVNSDDEDNDIKSAAAFRIQNTSLMLIKNLDDFRDLMPLVNVVSGLQKRGSEKEAKAFLKTGIANAKVASENQALWAFFDFAAIDEIAANPIKDAIPWINIDKLKQAVAGNTNKILVNVTRADINNALAGIMLANHIRLTRLSYPAAADRAGFGTRVDVFNKLEAKDSPVDRAVVAGYAVGGWDWYN
ncbi:MAG: DUF4157 domain-containing protein [Cellvibrio sp.]|uniref:eCIS core domain-containing protein n=1 Tax=Cellvibrio sp. TaxID=1965322 RepID=UPI0031A48692